MTWYLETDAVKQEMLTINQIVTRKLGASNLESDAEFIGLMRGVALPLVANAMKYVEDRKNFMADFSSTALQQSEGRKPQVPDIPDGERPTEQAVAFMEDQAESIADNCIIQVANLNLGGMAERLIISTVVHNLVHVLVQNGAELDRLLKLLKVNVKKMCELDELDEAA